MARYVDGYVTPVKKARLDEYRRLARKAGKIWIEHGALEFVECVGDDISRGKLTSFPRALHLKRGEVAMFSWIVYRSRAARDRVNKKVMEDPRLKEMGNMKSMPFDAQRMFFGGFKPLVRLTAE